LYVGKSALYFHALENVLFSILNFFLASLFLPLRSLFLLTAILVPHVQLHKKEYNSSPRTRGVQAEKELSSFFHWLVVWLPHKKRTRYEIYLFVALLCYKKYVRVIIFD
jgi:hypothetical protein